MSTRGKMAVAERGQPAVSRKRNEAVEEMPRHIEPMMALLSDLPRHPDGFGFEYKWDGIRALAYWDGSSLRLDGSNLRDITHRWPELAKIGASLGRRRAILDGEIVALDSAGRVSFETLQGRMYVSASPTPAMMRAVPIFYMIFDILYLRDRLTLSLPYVRRREILEGLRLRGPAWRTPPFYVGQGRAMFQTARENQLEGVMAKRLTSPYEPGRRGGAWLKIKILNRQEVVIGGWIPEKGSLQRGVGALLMGYYDARHRLIFAGKVGTGFTEAARQELKRRLDAIPAGGSPFANRVPDRDAIFVQPRLVGEVAYREWTSGGTLRHPSFKGLREDKDAGKVVREIKRPA